MRNFVNFFKHLRTVCKHKFYVMKYCFQARLFWQGLVHDLSKFNPIEFFEAVHYYQGNRSPIDACKEINGFSMAWLHHKGINRHHYEYWMDNFDKGGTPLVMPFKYALELICDYLAAGNAYSGKKFTLQGELDWWENKKKNGISMALETRLFVDEMMSTMAKENNTDILRKDIAIIFYEKALKRAEMMRNPIVFIDTSSSSLMSDIKCPSFETSN